MNTPHVAVVSLSKDPFAAPHHGPAIPTLAVGAIALGAVGTLALVGGVRLLGRAVIGAVAGLVAGIAMNQLHAVWSATEQKLGVPSAHGCGRAATLEAAEKLVGSIAREHEAQASSIAHYVMSAVTGSAYSLIPFASVGRGLAYGAAVWLVADEALIHVLGLSAPPWRFPLRTHARGLAAHLVYGVTLDALTRFTSSVDRDRA
jgi:hypothetical protein